VSPHYPGRTPAETSCEIDLGKKTNWVSLHGRSEQWFDYLTISGKKYSGIMSGGVKTTGNIKWTSDFWMETSTGWKICKSKKPSLKILESAKAKHMRLLKAAKARALRRSKARAAKLRRKRKLAEKKKKWAAARKAARIRAAKKAAARARIRAAKKAAAKRAAARRAAEARKCAGLLLRKGGWPGITATATDSDSGGVVAVYGKKFTQHSGYYQIDWPVVTLKGTAVSGKKSNQDGTWCLYAGCFSRIGSDTCHAICRSLTGTNVKKRFVLANCVRKKGYPPSTTTAYFGLYKDSCCNSKVWSSRIWLASAMPYPMKHCQCQGKLPKCIR